MQRTCYVLPSTIDREDLIMNMTPQAFPLIADDPSGDRSWLVVGWVPTSLGMAAHGIRRGEAVRPVAEALPERVTFRPPAMGKQ